MLHTPLLCVRNIFLTMVLFMCAYPLMGHNLTNIEHSSSTQPTVMEPTLMLRFVTNQGCNDSYCATIQVKVKEEGQTAQIGTSSIFVEYNPSAIAYDHYNSLRFNGVDSCALGVFSAWEEHGIDGDEPGKVNIVLTLSDNLKEYSCPILDSDTWVDVGQICFSIVSNFFNTDLRFSEDPSRTNFNINDPNDGTISIPVDFSNLGNVSELPLGAIEAPSLLNGSGSNEICISGTGNPTTVGLSLSQVVPADFDVVWQQDGVDLPPQNKHTVNLQDFTFAPQNLIVYVGDTVEWVNPSGNHNVNGSQTTFPSNPVSFSNGPASEGPWTFTHIFTEAGSYQYQSDPDINIFMQGYVTVYSIAESQLNVSEAGTYTAYLQSVSDPNCTSPISNSIAITQVECNSGSVECPSINDNTMVQSVCVGNFNLNGLLSNWEAGISINNDPDGTAGDLVVSGSAIGTNNFPSNSPNGNYNGNGCDPISKTWYAAYECDLDNDGTADEYLDAGTFTLNIYPTPQAPSLVKTYDADAQICTYTIEGVCNGDTFATTASSLDEACSASNLANVDITVTTAQGCQEMFSVAKPDCDACDLNCEPQTVLVTDTTYLCAGNSINLNSYLNILSTIEVNWTNTQGNPINNPSSINPTSNNCNGSLRTLTANYQLIENGCPVDYVYTLIIILYPEIDGTINNDGCTISFVPNCSNYEVSYDDGGGVQPGSTYTASEGSSGSLTFFVDNPNVANQACASDFATTYACEGCPSNVTLDPIVLQVCSGTTLDFTQYVNPTQQTTVNWTWGQGGTDPIEDPAAIKFNSTECFGSFIEAEATYTITDGGCITTYNRLLSVATYPEPMAEVIVDSCAVVLVNYCENYEVSWTDGNSTGDGPAYSASVGSTGTVSFTLNNPNVADACGMMEYTGNFNCPATTNCESTVILGINNTEVCSGSSLNLNTFLPNNANAIWYNPAGNEVGNPSNMNLSTGNCNGVTREYTAVYSLTENDCTTEYTYTLAISIYPKVQGVLFIDNCSIELTEVCDNFEVSWVDEEGNESNANNGTFYQAGQNTQGLVTFTITNPNGPVGCASQTYAANYDCMTCSDDEVILPPQGIAICSGEMVDLTQFVSPPNNEVVMWMTASNSY